MLSPWVIVVSVIAAAVLGVVADRVLDKSLGRLVGTRRSLRHLVGIGVGIAALAVLVALPSFLEPEPEDHQIELEQISRQLELLHFEQTRLKETLDELATEDVNDAQLEVIRDGLTDLEQVSPTSTHSQAVAIVEDLSLSAEDKVEMIRLLIMSDLEQDAGIQQQFDLVQSLNQSSPSIDVETMKLKRMIDKRSQTFDMLEQIIDKYNQSAIGIIESINR